MNKYKMLDHAADIKIRAFGKNREEVFINSALGMMIFIYGEEVFKETEGPGITERIKIEAKDPESLLIAWLSELLYSSYVKNRAYLDFKILEFNSHFIKAEVTSLEADARDDIKAVTYNELKLEHKNELWVAEVVYDI